MEWITWMKIVISVPGNDQAETDQSSFRKFNKHFPKTIFLDVNRYRRAIIWSNKYRNKQINVKWVFCKVDFALPLIHKYSTMILQNVVKDRICSHCSHFVKHMTMGPFYTVYFEGQVIFGSSPLVILREEREMHHILGGCSFDSMQKFPTSGHIGLSWIELQVNHFIDPFRLWGGHLRSPRASYEVWWYREKPHLKQALLSSIP